jgi:hypothetical protein
MSSFALRLTPELGPDVAEITIDNFRESFTLDLHEWTPQMYLDHWRARLTELLTDTPRVALMTWTSGIHDRSHRRAWVLHRESDLVHVQESLFITGHHDFALDSQGCVVGIPPREITSEDGSRISEWQTSLSALRHFLATVSNRGHE